MSKRILLVIAPFTALLHLGISTATAATQTGQELSGAQLARAESTPVVEHQTISGVIACRDPQVAFDEKQWSKDLMRQHMLVDIFVHKLWLNKDKTYIDKLFPPVNRDFADGYSRYSVIDHGGRCGNAPQLYIYAEYDTNQKLARYKLAYFVDGGTAKSVDSKWVE